MCVSVIYVWIGGKTYLSTSKQGHIYQDIRKQRRKTEISVTTVT